MKFSKTVTGVMAAVGLLMAMNAPAQDAFKFSVTGSEIPLALVRVNYGRVPKGMRAFDLIVCNKTEVKQPLTSSEIYEALAESATPVEPVGRQIMLALILQNQQRSALSVLGVAVNTAVGVLAALGASRSGVPVNVLAGAAVGAMVGQQLLVSLRPVLSADQVERYESQVLEPALVLDGASCVERTMFALGGPAKSNGMKLTFHIR